ncbi:MAG: hypothetical protein AAB074_11450 [Planctomycetota bacterium]
MRFAAALIALLASVAAADPETAGALKITRPAKWDRQDDPASKTAIFIPHEADAASKVALMVLPPEEVDARPLDWLGVKWDGMLKGGELISGGDTAALGDWVLRTGRIKSAAGKSWTRIYALRAGRKIQGVLFVAETKKLFERYAADVDKSLADASYEGKRAAAPKVKSAWSGVVMRNRYDALSKGYVWKSGIDHIVLFDNGLAANGWPDRGLDTLDYSVDPLAKLDYLGKVEETEKGLVITWEPGSTMTLEKGDGKLVEPSTHGEFFPMASVDGTRPEGTFDRPDNFYPNRLVLRADGTFEEQGVLALLSSLNSENPQKGRGTYAIRAWTLHMTYEDGITRSIAYEVTKGTPAKPERITLNTFGLDLKK